MFWKRNTPAAPAAPVRLDGDAIVARRAREDAIRNEENARRAREDERYADEIARHAHEDAVRAPGTVISPADLAQRDAEDTQRAEDLAKRQDEDARRAREDAIRNEEDPILAKQRDELFDGDERPPAKEKTSHLWVTLGLLVGAALGLLALAAALDNGDAMMAWVSGGGDDATIPDDGGDDSVAPPPPAPPAATATPVFPTTSFADRGKLVMTVEVVGTNTKLGAKGGVETYRLHEMRQDESGWVIYPSGDQLDLADLKKAGHSQSPHALKKGEKGRVECVEIDPESCQPG